MANIAGAMKPDTLDPVREILQGQLDALNAKMTVLVANLAQPPAPTNAPPPEAPHGQDNQGRAFAQGWSAAAPVDEDEGKSSGGGSPLI